MTKAALGSRSLSIVTAALALASVAYSAATPANAAPITYDLQGVTATFNGVTDHLTGNFTYDPTMSTGGESEVNITVSGTDAGTYDLLGTGSPASSLGFIQGLTSSGFDLDISFFSSLSNTSDVVSSINILDGTAPPIAGHSIAGSAVPEVSQIPSPATLPLFAAGLGALGLLNWRRNRKARVSLLGAA